MTRESDFPFSPAAQEALAGGCVCFGVRKAARIIGRLYDDALAEHGLTIGQFALMAHIEPLAAPSVQALADRMGMDQSALSRGLKPLEKAGLVASTPDPNDRRRRFLGVTDAGRRRFDEAARAWKEVQDRLGDAYGEESVGRLLGELRRLSSGIET